MAAVDPRRMCPNCRAFISSSDKVCPYCEAPVGERAVDRLNPSPIAGFIPAQRFVTSMILLVNVVLYALTALYSERGGLMQPDGEALLLFGAKFNPLISAGQWWRLLTAGFLHGGILHIIMNSYALLDLGAYVEESFGGARLVVIYVVSTITGFLLSYYWTPALSIGASAGIFGLLGAMIAFGTMHKHVYGPALRQFFVRWAVWGLVIGFLPGLRIDNGAHIGGLIGGIAMAYITRTPKLIPTFMDRVWQVLAMFCVVLVIASFGLEYLVLPDIQRLLQSM